LQRLEGRGSVISGTYRRVDDMKNRRSVGMLVMADHIPDVVTNRVSSILASEVRGSVLRKGDWVVPR
jgi:hypothetical protein